MDADRAIEATELASPMQEVARSGFAVVGLRVAAYGVGFGASVLITRALGPTGRGLYALPVAILGIVMALSHVGLEHANVFLAARGVSLRDLWANVTVASVLLALAGWLVLGFLALVGGGTAFRVPWTWLAIAVLQVPFLLHTIYWTNLLQLDGALVAAVRASVIGAVVHAAIAALMFWSGSLTPFRVLLLMWSANGTTWLVLLILGARHGLTAGRPDWAIMRRAFSFGLKATVGLLFFFLLLRVDQLMVRHILGVRPLGLYSLAVAIAEFLWLISDPFASSLLPFQVRAEGDDDRTFGYATARMTLVFAAGLAAIAWILAPYAIRFAYGGEFTPAVWPLRLLLPGIVVLSAQRPLSVVLLREGRPMLVTGLGLGALGVNLVINVALLPTVGIAGASIASSISYAALALAYVIATRKPGVVGFADLRPRGGDVRRLISGLPRRTS